MTRRLTWFLLALILLIGVPYYWLLLDNRPGPVPPKPVTIVQLRQLAAALPGPVPTEVEVELIAFRRLPVNFFAAGLGLKQKQIGVMVWRLPIAGQGPLVIDSGLDQAAADQMGMEQYDSTAWQRVMQAMGQSSQILITHEHPDHLGGLLSLAKNAAFAKARLNGPQKAEAGKITGVTVQDADRVTQGQPFTAAPGVVVIPAASHTPGSQMIYVRLSDGREYLFAGDIATLAQSWTDLRARSRLIGDYLAPENRPEVFAWLKTIRALKAAAPGLVVLPGHDFEWVINPPNRTGVRLHFSPVPD